MHLAALDTVLPTTRTVNSPKIMTMQRGFRDEEVRGRNTSYVLTPKFLGLSDLKTIYQSHQKIYNPTLHEELPLALSSRKHAQIKERYMKGTVCRVQEKEKNNHGALQTAP